MPANLENSAVATGLEMSVFIPIPKKGNSKECSNYHTTALISHTSKVMLKILQARLQQYMNCELSDVQAAKELMLLNCCVGEDTWESLGLQGDPTSPSERKSVLHIHWKDWFWSWSSNTLATWCDELNLWRSPWCWERLKAGGEEDDRGWDGWMVSLTQWTWVWVSSRSWWWTGRPGVL